MRTISPTATPLPTAYDCVAVYIAGRRTNLVVHGCRPKPTTEKPNNFQLYRFQNVCLVILSNVQLQYTHWPLATLSYGAGIS